MAYKDKDKEKEREYKKKWYRNKCRTDPKFKSRQAAASKKWAIANIEAVKELIFKFQKHGCRDCYETNPDCLCAHHKVPKNKKFNISKTTQGRCSTATLKKELKKCVCLCLNCHAKLHAAQRRRENKKEITNGKKL